MSATVKKTIFLPAELARDAEALTKAQGKSLSAVVRMRCAARVSSAGSRGCAASRATPRSQAAFRMTRRTFSPARFAIFTSASRLN